MKKLYKTFNTDRKTPRYIVDSKCKIVGKVNENTEPFLWTIGEIWAGKLEESEVLTTEEIIKYKLLGFIELWN